MNSDISLPTPFYNFLSIFVCIAVLFWFVRATKRFFRSLFIRLASMEQSLVLIRGLGNNLLFFDNATQQHMRSLVHTRQAKPPAQMKTLFIPFMVQQARLEWRGQNVVGCQANIWLAKRSYVFVLWGFNVESFKAAYSSVYSSSPLEASQLLISLHNGVHINMDQLRSGNCCVQSSSVCCLDVGSHNDQAFEVSRDGYNARDVSFAICIVPCDKGNVVSAAFRGPISQEEQRDVELGNIVTNGNSIKNALHSANYAANLTDFNFGINVFEHSIIAAGNTDAASTICTAVNQYFSANNGMLYSSAEIFGLKASSKSNASTTPVPQSYTESSSPDAVAQSQDDECVVCLSDLKAVVLMPCRHMCVCASCLAFIDKCPVCRSRFSEYVVFENQTCTPMRMPHFDQQDAASKYVITPASSSSSSSAAVGNADVRSL